MNEMDKLLAQLKAEYDQKEEKTDKFQPKKSLTPPQGQTTLQHQSPSPLDNLLAEVKSEFEGKTPSQKQPTSERQFVPKLEDNLLKELQTEHQEQAQHEAERRQKQIVAEQHLQKQRRQRRRQDLRLQAQQWLKRLNPKSEEGIWFAEFSYSYESKLEAAIDYLEALRESDFNKG